MTTTIPHKHTGLVNAFIRALMQDHGRTASGILRVDYHPHRNCWDLHIFNFRSELACIQLQLHEDQLQFLEVMPDGTARVIMVYTDHDIAALPSGVGRFYSMLDVLYAPADDSFEDVITSISTRVGATPTGIHNHSTRSRTVTWALGAGELHLTYTDFPSPMVFAAVSSADASTAPRGVFSAADSKLLKQNLVTYIQTYAPQLLLDAPVKLTYEYAKGAPLLFVVGNYLAGRNHNGCAIHLDVRVDERGVERLSAIPSSGDLVQVIVTRDPTKPQQGPYDCVIQTIMLPEPIPAQANTWELDHDPKGVMLYDEFNVRYSRGTLMHKAVDHTADQVMAEIESHSATTCTSK